MAYSNYEIIGESIKSATSIRLGELFDNPIRYKENITNQQYPNFHIIQINTNITPRQHLPESVLNNDLRRVQIDYSMNIQYRVASDTELITNLRQRLDEIGLKLVSEFNYITLDRPMWVTNSRYEIVDGVLQFFFNVAVFATLEQQDDPTMEDLTIEENLKEEEE